MPIYLLEKINPGQNPANIMQNKNGQKHRRHLPLGF
jgi:hypothetical protein